MKKDIKLLIEKFNSRRKEKKFWKKVTSVLSCIVVFITVYCLMSPAITESTNETYTLHLKDSYNTSVKAYDLKLHFVDTKGNYIEGSDITIDIGSDELNTVSYYGFGYVPTENETPVGLDLVKKLNLTEKVMITSEKYVFDHAEVKVNDTWQTFKSDSGKHQNLWYQDDSNSTEVDSYGWRGNYEMQDGTSTGYTITDNTGYKFVYKLVRQGQNNSVASLGADSGIAFNIFNYTGDNKETGINANGLYDYFSFRDGNLTTSSYINPNTDADGFGPNRVKVEPKLDSNGYPVFDCQGYCDNDSTIKNTSLGYLFGSKTNAIGTDTIGVEAYSSTNTILQKETIEGVEYYYYDSNRNAVDYDTDNNRFLVRDYKERGYIITTYANESNRYEFLPFNYLVQKDSNKNYDYESENDKTEIDHWYGMTMEFDFYMPADGKINDKEMIFSFSGDDDVWVFIDDVLVLDLGGTHGSVDGSINFSTGKVESYLNWNGTVGTGTAGTRNETSIYKTFENANATDLVVWNSDKTTFKKYTRHTLKFFYLERGGAIANCKIRFNIPVLPSGTLSVGKQFHGEELSNEDYEFVLYDVTSNSPVSKDTSYTIGEEEFYINNNEGRFKLKNNEVAIFKLINNHTYYVEETNAGNYAVPYSCKLNSSDCDDINKTIDFQMNPESKHQAIFTNKAKTFELNITKKAINSTEDEIFKFKISLNDENESPVDINDVNINIPNECTVDLANKGIVTCSLKNETNATITGIPVNTKVTIKEVEHDGYQTIIKSVEEGKEITVANGDTYEFNMDLDKNIIVYNTPGVELPETGGIGIFIYIFIGISLILVSIKYGYSYFFKKNKKI